MKLFFVVGTGRCGTQMLRNVLNTWENVVILPETHFIVTLYDKYELKKINCNDFLEVVTNIYGASGVKWIDVIINSSKRNIENYKKDFEGYIINKNISGNIRNFVEAFYEFLYGEDLIFGDKTPHYGTNLSIINKIWPEAKIIHLIRDGVDSAHSMLGHQGFAKYINGQVKPKDLDRVMYKGKQVGCPDYKPTMSQALRFWENVILVTQNELKCIKDQNKLEVKYEDIVFFPGQEISKIATFLEIDDNKKLLNRAISIPRPFPENRQVKKFGKEEYDDYLLQIKETMKLYNYPYHFNADRGLAGILREWYRGRYYYLLLLKKNIIKFIKIIIGKV